MCSTKLGRIKIIHFCFLNFYCLLSNSQQKSHILYIFPEIMSLWLWCLIFVNLTCLNHENETPQPITKVTYFLEACIKIQLFKINEALIVCSVPKDVAWYCILPPRKQCIIVE